MRDLPLGYHTIRLSVSLSGAEWSAEQSRIVVPSCCRMPDDLLGDENAFGLIANLYTIRSAANWGVGDFGDLATLAAWGGSVGADFVGVNPLHALLNRGDDVSPYNPVSRLFRNPLYVDVARVPQVRAAPAVRERLTSPELAAELDALRESPSVRYEQVMAVKGIALDALHRGAERGAEFDAFIATHDPALSLFATWMTLANATATIGGCGRPSCAREQRGGSASRQSITRAWGFTAGCTSRRIGSSPQRPRGAGAGMRIGPIRISRSARHPPAPMRGPSELFAHGVSVGAPPDPYAMQGQNWGFPPIDPHALRRTRYRYFVDLLRAGFRHAGALRIDHVLGFFRLFWIPDGKSGADRAYGATRRTICSGILASERACATTRSSWERSRDRTGRSATRAGEMGRTLLQGHVFRARADRRVQAAHELSGARPGDRRYARHGADRRLLEQARPRPSPDASASSTRQGERGARAPCRGARSAARASRPRDGALPRGRSHSPAELRGAIHAFLSRTPSRLVGLSLDDLAGESEPVNVPGVGPDKFKSWTRRMKEPLEVLMASDDAATALRCDGRRGVRT